MCERAIKDKSETLEFIPDHFKTQNMCDKAVEEGPCALEFVPDWFVTHQQVQIWHDDDYHDDDQTLLSGTMVMKNTRPKKQK